MTAHDAQRAKILNERVIGDWQLRVPVTRRETTEPEDRTGVGFRSRFVDNPIRFVQLEGCGNARTIVNAMEHRVIKRPTQDTGNLGVGVVLANP